MRLTIMKNWTESKACLARREHNFIVCLFCRTRGAWQDHMAAQGFQNPRDAVCPEGFPLWQTPPPLLAAQQSQSSGDAPNQPPRSAESDAASRGSGIPAATGSARPPVTLKKILSLFQAILLSSRVTEEVEQQRLTICATCDRRRVPTDGTPPYCGMCGCKVSEEGWQLRNLTHYAENLPKWGCKHPFRGWTGPRGQKPGWPLPSASSSSTPTPKAS
jgi:hypothetical protein